LVYCEVSTASQHAKNSTDLVAEFCKRLEQVIAICADVAKEEKATFRKSEHRQIPFSAPMIAEGVEVPLPTATIRKGNVEVDIRPSEISQDASGKHHGGLFVDRKWVGLGRLDSPACWTGVEEEQDTNWYVGPTGNKSQVVDRVLIRGWLYHSGPRPIW